MSYPQPPIQVMNQETIAAQATALGRSSVGIVRVSGPKAAEIAAVLVKQPLTPRHAHYLPFHDRHGNVIDQGLALFFPGPHSFTGEDVLELQGHGGPVVLDLLLKEITRLGARLARPGEFSERAFLNDKIDLAQAEAIADLIDSASEEAARSAMRTLQGAFSERVNRLVEELIKLRVYVEAAIDFPEEEIDFLSDGKVSDDLDRVMTTLATVFREVRQGTIIRDGMTVVIAGRPNAGKSSLLNALSGRDSAIVTNIAGTTRDILREHIHIDGMPLHIIDTAGLRDSSDVVEQIGVQRAFDEIAQADLVLLMVDSTTTDATDPHLIWPEFVDKLPAGERITVIRNKCDLSGEESGLSLSDGDWPVLRLCAQSGAGVDNLRQHLKACMGFTGTTEGSFSARRRHIEALEQAQAFLDQGRMQLHGMGAGELLAEDLRQAQQALGEITGEFSSNDLLGRIFSSFCIGK